MGVASSQTQDSVAPKFVLSLRPLSCCSIIDKTFHTLISALSRPSQAASCRPRCVQVVMGTPCGARYRGGLVQSESRAQ